MKFELKVAVIMIARNEEKYIAKSLENIINQELSPSRFILINDGSLDNTGKIASQYDSVEVIERPKRKESYLARKELAHTINEGLEKIADDEALDYVMIMGTDSLIPKDYLSKITQRMNSDQKLVITSGVIGGEYSVEPRGSGRVVKIDFWKKLGLKYPANYGYEGYLLLKAQSMGYNVTTFNDLIINTQRKTGSRFNSKLYFYYGLGLKALGYTSVYTLGKALLFAKRKPSGAFYLLKGYFSNYEDLYEQELRDYVRKSQFNSLANEKGKYFKRILRMLSH